VSAWRVGAPVRIADGRAGRFAGVHRTLEYDRHVPRWRQWAVVELDRGGRTTVAFDRLELVEDGNGAPSSSDEDDDELERFLGALLG
jgi:hypothetical protein